MLIQNLPLKILLMFIGLGVFNFLGLLFVALSKKKSLENFKNKFKTIIYYITAIFVMAGAFLVFTIQAMGNSFSISWSQYIAIISVFLKIHFVAIIVLFQILNTVIYFIPFIIASVVNSCKKMVNNFVMCFKNFVLKVRDYSTFNMALSSVRLNI